MGVKARVGNRKFSPEMKAECWKCKTELEESGRKTVGCSGCVQTISSVRNKLLLLLSQNYFDFCYNSQIYFLILVFIFILFVQMGIWTSKRQITCLKPLIEQSLQAVQIWCFLLAFLSDMEMPVKSYSSFSRPKECLSQNEMCILEHLPGWAGKGASSINFHPGILTT